MPGCIPVIDLFAGPGGLGEGFSAFRPESGGPAFRVRLSVEKESYAHETLQLRSFFRQFSDGDIPEAYYDHLRDELDREELFAQFPDEAERAASEAWCTTLGEEPTQNVDERIRRALESNNVWVLLGGPPCQAYSLAGRSRTGGIDPDDPRVYLYREYLRIIAAHSPPVFVMENVKGLLSSRVKDTLIVEQILEDLKDPAAAVRNLHGQNHLPGDPRCYKLYSFTKQADRRDLHGRKVLEPIDFVIKSEEYGVPQARHRVIVLGVREDLDATGFKVMEPKKQVSVSKALVGLPRVRSGLSKGSDNRDAWRRAVRQPAVNGVLETLRELGESRVAEKMNKTLENPPVPRAGRGDVFVPYQYISVGFADAWFLDERLGGACNHSTRAHIAEDLHRYLFAACYARVHGQSPMLASFPEELLPNHKNVKDALDGGHFADRFRVQVANRPATTVNSPSVRVIFTIRNGVLDPTLIDGRRRVYIWPIEDASLVADLSFGKPRATTLADGAEVSAPELVAYQDSSGGDKWQELGGGNYERWLSRYTEGREVRGVTFRGYKVTGRGEELAAGDRHLGVVDVAGERAGVTAALRNFRVEYPSAVGAADGHLRVGLFPGEFAEPFHLNSGQRKSWDVRLTLHGPDKPDLARAHAVQDALLLFRPDPAWMVRCAAAGAWPSGLALFAPERPPRLRWEAKPDLDGIHTGWDWYGWISSWNAGGAHWNQSTCFAPWVLWADGANLDQAESRALWAGDVCAIHYDDAPMETFWLMLRSWNWRENRLVAETPPGYYSRDTWGLPDSGHMGMFMWPEYYLITGDARAREAWEHLGIRARAFCWQHNHDDKADGTGPLPRAIHWCRKRDPDTEPEFRLADRYRGWPLYGLAQYYRLTGRPELLAEARTVARAFRNTARMSPIGFMVTQINAKDDPSVYGRQGPFETGRAESASQCYAHFQQGIMATGLVEYYLMSRDIEALDALVAFADQTCHHSMIRDPEGNRKGWTYTFGDYWGPYTWEDCDGHRVSFFASNFRVLQPLGFIYTLTGRQDYRDVLRDAFNEPRRGGYDGSVIAAWMAVKHPKARAQPPAAVDDLTAEPLGGGRAELTWTAPEGAAWYQVKWSEADIVERVSGWPDRTPPLPEDAEQWHARAEAFNARQRSFWAANNAPATPMPARAAGETETVVVEGLPAGAVRFAVKAWDEADNISELSNVVRIDIENNE